MNKTQYIAKVIIALALTSCAKYDPLNYLVQKPENIQLQEDIDSYDPLKAYINRTSNPNFKLGVAVNASAYNNKDVIFRLANRNFDEIVLHYHMKHGAIVKNDGSLDLSQVENTVRLAQEANMHIYGHTLMWHANQNAGYLNSLIQPIIIPGESKPTWDVVTSAYFETNDNSNYLANENAKLSFAEGVDGKGKSLKISNEKVRTNDWDAQFFITFSPAVKAGEKYELSFDIKSDHEASFGTQAHTVPYSYKHWDFFGSINSTPKWTKYTKEITITEDMANCGAIAFNLGKTATNYYFDNVTLKKYNEKGSSNAGYSLTFTNPSVVDFWSAQTAYDVAPLQNNKEYILKFAVKGSAAGAIRAEVQSTTDYSSDGFGRFDISPEWREYELKTTTTKAGRNRFVISHGDYKGTVYLDNISLTVAGSSTNLINNGDFENGMGNWIGWGNSSTRALSKEGEGYGGSPDQVIHKTDEEKKAILTNALENWLSQIIPTTKSVVKAWDVINEPMDDGKPYDLKTGKDKTLSDNEFYWQDYLGKDYGVKTIQIARQHLNNSDLLFVNDYNLEYNLDKCKGLIEYVNYIETKGQKVDGIGTQMHIDINSDKTKITEMFKLLAATKKWIKISELDIGLGNIKTENATTQYYQDQAEMYKFVIDQYFEQIPSSQRYGITLWSPLDAGTNGWRANEPVGIWTEKYVRKLAYTYVSEALEKNTK